MEMQKARRNERGYKGMSKISSSKETKYINESVFEGYTGDFETGMKINAKTRDKIMEIHRLSWNEPLESLVKLLPEAKRRAEDMVLTIECNHVDTNYFRLCEILWDKYKTDNNLDINEGYSYFIPSITRIGKWPIKKFQKYLIKHIDKLIRIDAVKNIRRFDRLMHDLGMLDTRVHYIGLHILIGKVEKYD